MKKVILSSVLGITAGWILSCLLVRNPEKIYNKHFTDYENIICTRNACTYKYSEIMVLYGNGQYKKALQEFNKLNSDRSFVCLYKGICMMHLEQFDNAIREFEKLYFKKDQFKEQADWYTGLCYLKKGYEIAAVKHFEAIAKSGSYYKKEAKKIINRL